MLGDKMLGQKGRTSCNKRCIIYRRITIIGFKFTEYSKEKKKRNKNERKHDWYGGHGLNGKWTCTWLAFLKENKLTIGNQWHTWENTPEKKHNL